MVEYVWKKPAGSDDHYLVKKGAPAEEENALVILSRMNSGFPWSVYVEGKKRDDIAAKVLSHIEDEKVSSYKKYILDNISDLLAMKESLKEENEMKKYYEAETGVLLKPEDDEYDSYKMDGVYDGEHSFYDEDQFAFPEEELDKWKEVCRKYVEDGVNNTYAIIKGPFTLDDDTAEAIASGKTELQDEIEEFDYDINNVIWSIYKNKDGEIVEDFLKVEESLEEGKTVQTKKQLDDDVYVEYSFDDKKYYLASDYDRYVWTNFDSIEDAESFYKYHKNDVRNSILEKLEEPKTEEMLTEAPDDDGIMSDDELDAQEKAERDEFEARMKARRDAVAQQRADRDAKVARQNELKAKAETLVKEIGDDWTFENLFDKLVPSNGKCDTLAGELVRAANKIEYRWFNDGDKFNEGYGIETCGQPAYFLAMFEPDDNELPFWNIISDVDMNDNDDEYDKWVENLKEAVVNYIYEHQETLAMDTADMYDAKEDDVRRWLDDNNLIMTFEYDLDMPEELMAHLEKGNISDTDVEWEVENYVNSDSNIYVYERDGYISFEGITRDERDDLQSNGYKWLEQYADSLTNEYGDPYEEDEDEEEPEEGEDNEEE